MDATLHSTNCVEPRHRGTLPRSWDAFDAYLFDIDGTLINCKDAVHYFAFCAALKSLSGRNLNLDGVTAHGNTDVGILRDALMLAFNHAFFFGFVAVLCVLPVLLFLRSLHAPKQGVVAH